MYSFLPLKLFLTCRKNYILPGDLRGKGIFILNNKSMPSLALWVSHPSTSPSHKTNVKNESLPLYTYHYPQYQSPSSQLFPLSLIFLTVILTLVSIIFLTTIIYYLSSLLLIIRPYFRRRLESI